MATWTTIGNGRMTGGGLWLPELSISLIGNDYAAVISNFDMAIPSTSSSNGTTAYQTVGTPLTFTYPAITHDDQYTPMTLRLALWVNHASDDGNVGYTLRFRDTTNSVNSSTISNAGASTSASNDRALLTYASSAGAWPTGSVTVELQISFANTSPASSATTDRGFGTYGPQCSFSVVAT